MESWNYIVNAVLLGTEKRSIRGEDLDAQFAEQFSIISERIASREEVLLNTASLIYNFRQCGFSPLHKEGISLPEAPNEEKQYAIAPAHVVLSDILESGSISLLHFWLLNCAKQNKIVLPE